MNFISIEIRDDDSGLEWSIPLERRITILRGDSGKGKTEMVRLLQSDVFGVTVESQLPIVVADNNNWQIILENTNNSIIILDDVESVATLKFAQLLKKTEDQGNYYLIIGREYLEGNKSDTCLGNLSFSIKSVLRIVTDETGKRHTVEPYYNVKNVTADDVKNFVIITEDTGAGYIFFKNCLWNVDHSSNGKSSMVDDTLRLALNLDTDTKIISLFDTAAFGCHMDEMHNRVLRNYSNVIFDLAFECFEYLLLSTNYLNVNLDNEVLNKHLSWELSYQELLVEYTKNSQVKYIHKGSLRECWYMNCTSVEDSGKCNEYIKRKCKYLVEIDKFDYLLKGTVFEKYLKLRCCNVK